MKLMVAHTTTTTTPVKRQALLKRDGELTGDSSIEQISHVYGKQAVVISVDPRRVSMSDRLSHEVRSHHITSHVFLIRYDV